MIRLFYYDKKLKSMKFSKQNVEKLRKKKAKIWIDLLGDPKKELSIIKKLFFLHPLTVEDLVKRNIRVKIEEFKEYLVIVMYGIEKNSHKETVHFHEVDLVLGKDFIISSHAHKFEAIEKLMKNSERLEELFSKGVDYILHKIIDSQVDNYFPVLDLIDEDIEKIEDDLTKKADKKVLGKIIKLKKQIVSIKKIVIPQREKISTLAKEEYRFISKRLGPYFRDVYDHIIRISDMIEGHKEELSSAFDAYMSTVSNNMNEVMKMLSIIATIALPLTVISGIYGTNFKNLPGQYHPYGFWIMLIGMIAMCTISLAVFRKKGFI